MKKDQKLEIKKIQDKKEIEVVVQENCRVVGKPELYVPGQDCLHDCNAFGKPDYYKNPNL